MRRLSYLKAALAFLMVMLAYQSANAIAFKSIRIGRYQQGGIADVLAQDELVLSKYRNFWYGDNFYRHYYWTCEWHLGVRDFTDTLGITHPYMIANSPRRPHDEIEVTVPQYLDADQNTIHRYFRYAPPEIWVDGIPYHEPLYPGDFVAPDSIEFYGGGNTEVMIRSKVNTWIGLTIDAKTLAFSQVHHDQYIIFDWTFTNTGLLGRMDTPALNDTLKDVYFMRGFQGSETSRNGFGSRYGEYPGDSLRMSYSYPARGAYSWDRLGCRNRMWSPSGTLSVPYYFGGSRRLVFFGEAVLHCDSTAADPIDALHQPFNTGNHNTGSPWELLGITDPSPEEKEVLYLVMREGFNGSPGHGVVPLLEDLGPDEYGRLPYPGTHHEIRLDQYRVEMAEELPWYMYGVVHFYGMGSWTLAPGEDFRVVISENFGGLGITEAQEVNEKWQDNTLTWGDYSYSDYPNGDTPDNVLPAEFHINPPARWHTQEDNSEWRPDSVNWAKDNWMHTGKDSLFKNAFAAQYNVQHNYMVPIAPPPPSVEIQSQPDKIVIYWGSNLPSSPGAPFESEDAPDFVGYRIYRSSSLNDDMELIADISDRGTYQYDDTTAERGRLYYYAVTAYDNGTANGTDVYNTNEVLESGKFINRTTRGAHLVRGWPKPLSIDSFRVVPNPFHINAYDLQFGRSRENMIMFMGLPPVCTIRIYTESGDLVKTIEHDDWSGDESWGDLANEHQVTDSGQRIVSGVYIAYIEVPNDERNLPLKGQSSFQKFVVVR
ncbi:hypothetical protein ACFL4K_01145 [Candidatus Neomarinimicrobiota bacterium]